MGGSSQEIFFLFNWNYLLNCPLVCGRMEPSLHRQNDILLTLDVI